MRRVLEHLDRHPDGDPDLDTVSAVAAFSTFHGHRQFCRRLTLQARQVFRHVGAPTFGAASTALRIGDEFWFGTPHGDRIAIAPVN